MTANDAERSEASAAGRPAPWRGLESVRVSVGDVGERMAGSRFVRASGLRGELGGECYSSLFKMFGFGFTRRD